MKSKLVDILKMIGPGIAVAATGVGAGDMVAAAVSGAKYGTIILWAAVFGAIIKFSLNEGIARWQLATQQTILEGWAEKFGRWVSIGFGVYLVLWSFIVAGALISACGLAAHAMFPQLPVAVWGIIHSIAAVFLIYLGRYLLFESMMKTFIGLMFIIVLTCAVLVNPDWTSIIPSIALPRIPEGSGKFLLGVIGGVGGSVSLLNYSYWIRERKWEGKKYKKTIEWDLGIAYSLTGLFGVAVMIIAAGVSPEIIMGNNMVLAIAGRLETVSGLFGKWVFLFGFWGAVFSSMLGVWQGVPYIFTDFMQIQNRQRKGVTLATKVESDSLYYKGFLLFLAFPPMLLLLFDKPVWIVVIYSIAGAMFMPFLAISLLYMNNREKWVGNLKNRWYTNALLIISLVVFGYLCLAEFIELF